MKKMSQNLIRYLLFIFIVLIPLNCATFGKKESKQDLDKTKPVAEESKKTAFFITKLTPKILEDRSIIYIKATGPLHYTAFKLTDPLRLILDIADIQPNSEVKETIQFNKGAVSSINTQYFDESNITRVIIGLNQNVHYDIAKAVENELEINIDLPKQILAKAGAQPDIKAPPMETPERPESEFTTETEKTEIDEIKTIEEELKSIKKEKKYIGQPISLDFQNADLKSILRLIAEVSGLNVITSSEVEGTVNLRLIEVPWDQVLDLILKNNKLGMEREGNIIRIASLKKLAEEKEAEINAEKAAQKAKKTKEESEELIFTTIRISYAELADIKEILEGMKSERGDIKVDDRTKTLIIYEIQSKIDEMKDLIKILDKRTQQVTIQARIVEVNTNFTREFGIQWGGSFAKTTSKIFPNTIQLTGGPAGSTTNYLVDLPAAVTTGTGGAIGLSLGSLTGAALLDIQLSAMEDSGDGRILSSPKVTTMNHKKATIQSGRSFFIETVSAEGTQTEEKKALIELTVTPHITPDGYIHLEIEAKKDQPDFANLSAGGNPSILRKNVQTEVLVKSGDTTVLGGLYTTTKAKATSGVPFFSKIPVLGWLFKNEQKTADTEELLIFITPTIVEN